MQTFRQLHRILINCWSSWINTRWLWVFVPDGRIIYDGDAHDPKAVVQPELDEEVGAL